MEELKCPPRTLEGRHFEQRIGCFIWGSSLEFNPKTAIAYAIEINLNYSQINIISHNSEHKKSLSGEHLSFRLMLLA